MRNAHAPRHSRTLELSVLATVIASCTIAGCHSGPNCTAPSPPTAGSQGPVVITRGNEGGGALATSFGGREWASPAPSVAANTHIEGHAIVTSNEQQLRLRVATTTGRQIELQLVRVGCA